MSNEMIALAILGVIFAQVLAVALLVLRLAGVGAPLTVDDKQTLGLKVVGILLGVVATELLQFNFIPAGIFPNAAPLVLYGLCGIIVGAGGDVATALVKLFGAGAQFVTAKVDSAKAQAAHG